MNREEFNKLMKGCGKNFFVGIQEVGVIEFKCGRWVRMPTEVLWDKLLWCPICAEKIIEEQKKQLRENEERSNND